jgi:DNA-binding sugar fermentation-stimulating protein
VTITEEVAADLVAEEAQVVLEAIEVLVAKEEVQEVLVQEVAETEVRLQNVKVDFHQTDQQEKAVLEVKEVHQLQEENQVQLKEKKELQDVLTKVLIDQQVVHLTQLK